MDASHSLSHSQQTFKMSPTTKNSIVPVQITPMNLRIVGHVLIDSKEEDETIDIGDYEDVRIEMLATGHHLVRFYELSRCRSLYSSYL